MSRAYLVQRESWVAGNREAIIKRNVRNLLLCFFLCHTRPDLAQCLAHKEDAIDQKPICRTLDFKVAEEGVCAEKQ